MTFDAPFLFVDPEDCVGRRIHDGQIKILNAPTWHGDQSPTGHNLYRCLAVGPFGLAIILIRLTVEIS